MSDHRLARATAGFTFILPLLLPPLTGFSVDRSTDVPSFQRCFSYLDSLSLSLLPLSLPLSLSVTLPPRSFLPASSSLLCYCQTVRDDCVGLSTSIFSALCPIPSGWNTVFLFFFFFFCFLPFFERELMKCCKRQIVSDRSMKIR